MIASLYLIREVAGSQYRLRRGVVDGREQYFRSTIRASVFWACWS